jgi:anti-sigma factor RsiW
MTNENTTLSEREEIETLLPWFATNKLDADDQIRVETYLDAHPEMRAQLAIIEDERHAAILGNEAIQAPAGMAGLERLRQSIAAERTLSDRAAEQAAGWFSQLASIFTSPTPTAVRWAGAAAAVVLLAQAVTIGTLMNTTGPEGPGYETASGTKTVATGTRVLIQFEPSASAERIAAALNAAGAEIVAGPRQGGLFEVRLSSAKLSADERDAAIARLRADKGLIKLILPSG